MLLFNEEFLLLTFLYEIESKFIPNLGKKFFFVILGRNAQIGLKLLIFESRRIRPCDTSKFVKKYI